MLDWMGLNFYHYDDLQPKMRAVIINEHVLPTGILRCFTESRNKNKSAEKGGWPKTQTSETF